MKTILVAEDNESNYILMTYILKKDYQIFRAANGQEAVAKVEEGGVDLILMDIKMPVMDGLEATRIIRAKNPDLPIIALTANAFDSDRDSALQAGCNEFITKPVNRQMTLDTIAKYI